MAGFRLTEGWLRCGDTHSACLQKLHKKLSGRYTKIKSVIWSCQLESRAASTVSSAARFTLRVLAPVAVQRPLTSFFEIFSSPSSTAPECAIRALFALGIIGTGLLAVPVLAGSAAYAVSEVYGWKAGLSRGFRDAKGFYLIIVAATGIGTVMGYLELDPIKALIWSAIVNGVISVPIMAALLLIGQSSKLMCENTIKKGHKILGWTATALMAVAVLVMLATSY